MEAKEIQNIKKYLPSKKLGYILGGSALVVIIILVATSKFGHTLSFGKKHNISASTVGELVGKDSNKNGIADWEESLWGLDPKGNGNSNKAIIEAKRREAAASSVVDPNYPVTAGTPNDTVTRELLSTILALQQADALTPEAVTNIALSMGVKINQNRTSIDTYSADDLQSVPETVQSVKDYGKKIGALTDKYGATNMGTEFDIIDEGLTVGSEDALKKLDAIADNYISFSEELIHLPTPQGAKYYVLPFANSLASLGKSLKKIENIYTDSIGGLTGIGDYTQAINTYERATDRFSDYFTS